MEACGTAEPAGAVADNGGRDAQANGGAGPPTEAPVDWAAVRRAYEESGETVAGILRRFGVTARQLRYRRETEGWRIRPSTGGRRGDGETERRAALRLRELLLLHGTLTSRLAAEVAAATVFDIRHAEALLVQARSRRALMPGQEGRMPRRRKPAQVTKKAGSADKKNNNDANQRNDDLAWLRAELKRRLEDVRRETGSG